MSKYKLIYFNAKGIGEAIRMILIHSGKQFQDIRVDYNDWISKLKKETPFGKLPILKIDNRIAHQSMAICRYIGKETNLAGSNNWQDLEIDMNAETFIDFKQNVTSLFLEEKQDIKEKKLQILLNETIPYYFGRFDGIIQENGGYFGHTKLSWADFYLVGYSETVEAIVRRRVFEEYTNMAEHRRRIYRLPKIKQWILNRPITEY
ncbi:hypothetical protein O3M35_008079 [Rhynocoris fuscipes]|uniref:glutathione transferase n=1 Tax=Rhynocoris fuscipes TaxID=488301 RepID=A0AAW1D5T8_9HEMI